MEPDRPLSSDEEEDAPLFPGLPAAGPQRRMGNRIGLQDFLQLIVAGGGAELRAAANNNEELVQHLWRGGTIKSPAVKRALLACRRDMFMPENYTEDAFIDAPVRVEELGFNISAPHIHATALEALELQEGDTLLDVGCGCGLLSAAAAQLVGPGGQVKAIDIRPACLDLSQRAVARLREEDTDYAEASCTIQWKLQNVFIPSADHVGKYSKVYVGAACPRDRLRDVLKLLRPEGGLLLVPVDSQLLLFKKAADGKLGRKTLSSVRFSELEVPRDVEVVLAVMKDDMDRARHIQVPPSTLTQDLAPLSPSTTPATPPALRQGVQGQAARQARDALGRLAPSGDQAMEEGGDETAPAPGREEARPPELAGTPKRHKPEPGLVRQPSYLQVLPDGLAHLGPPDCYLHGVDEPPPDTGGSSGQEGGGVGAGGHAHSQAGSGSGWGKVWRLPAHRAVLQARCEHFRARFLSGMRDAQEDALAAPEGVSAAAVRALLHYVYQDRGVQELQLPLEQVTEVLHVAVFYGCPRLISLCEQRLADVLATPEEGAEEAAAQLLALAEEVGGLPQLRTLALAYIVDNYPAISRSDSYKQLPRPLVDLIAEQACAHANRMLASLKGLAGIKPANNDTGGPGMAGLLSFARTQRNGVDAAADDSEDLDF